MSEFSERIHFRLPMALGECAFTMCSTMFVIDRDACCWIHHRRTSTLYRLRLMLVLTVCVSVMACVGPLRTRPQATADCPLMPEADAVRMDSIPLARLAGRSRLIFVDTVNPRRPPERAHVELHPPDSAFLAMFAEINRQEIRFDPRTRPRLPPPLVEFLPDRAMWLAGPFGMSAGACLYTRCMDDSPTFVSFRYLTPRSVRGIWWNNMTGIAMPIDRKTGRRLPTPAGILCMLPM